ncbi:DUF6545 domain-containing protein [Streptomyces sp. NPDC001793]|uniref:DUF6545 domain-containing protein n=1 Tax=Streptomyces sp. NPDC001793 TaxID=3154657 RepID=UPI003319DF2D
MLTAHRTARTTRTLWRLRPLWNDLTAAVPRITPDRPLTSIGALLRSPRAMRLRLYRQVIEIRDAPLTLEGHVTPSTVARAQRGGYEPGSFDLIHARYLYCHLPTREAMVERAARWLAPGGWLVIEEPYHLPAETSPFPAVQRLLTAYQRMYREHGADMAWARGLPALLARSGLTEVSFTGNLGCMGGLDKDRWRPLISQAAPALLAEGLVTEGDLGEFSALLDDPAFIDIPQVTISAWGRRATQLPATPATS